MATVVRHPLNDEFDWVPRRPPFRCITPLQAESYNELGYFVMEDMFDPQTVADVMAEIDPLEREFEAMLRQTEGGKAFIARVDEITFTTHIVTRSERLRHLVASSPLIDVCADLIGPNVRLTCWIALTDATEENGCPWVVPGMHRMGTLRHHMTDTGLVCFEQTSDATSAPVRAGGMVVFSSLTPHCTGPNRTDEPRKAYIVQYAPNGSVVFGVSRREASRTTADAPERQFPVLMGGRPVS